MGPGRRRRGLLLLALLLTGTGDAVAAAGDSGPPPEPLPLIEFRLKDQMDVLHTSGYFRHSVVVLISGDRKGHKFMGAWSPVLADSLAAEIAGYRVKLISHAHLEGAPFFVKGKIKGSFSEDPAEWVLLDWDGEFKEAYDLAEDHCSIVVFDDAGIRRHQVAVQDFDPEVFDRTLALIRALTR